MTPPDHKPSMIQITRVAASSFSMRCSRYLSWRSDGWDPREQSRAQTDAWRAARQVEAAKDCPPVDPLQCP
jgi:hypothetical protein